MKKAFSITAIFALFLWATACDNGDDVDVVTRSVKVLNHAVDTITGKIYAPSLSTLHYTWNRTISTMNTELEVSLGTDSKTMVKFTDMPVTANAGIYGFASNGGADKVKGYLNINESSVRLYHNAGSCRIISTLPEVFSLHNTTVSRNAAKTHTGETEMYQFNINPETMTAQVLVMKYMDIIEHSRSLDFVRSLGYDAKVVPTKNGYEIHADHLATIASFSQNGKHQTTKTDYPINDFKAFIDLEGNTLNASFKLGGSNVTVTGKMSY